MTIKYLSLASFIFISSTLVSALPKTPDLGSPEEAFLNPSQEALMGKQFMNAVRYQVPVLKDAIVDDYLSRLGQRLTQTTDYPQYHFSRLMTAPSMLLLALVATLVLMPA